MNDREIMESAIRGMKSKAPAVDPRPFWVRLLASLRAKISGTPDKPRIEITGGTDF